MSASNDGLQRLLGDRVAMDYVRCAIQWYNGSAGVQQPLGMHRFIGSLDHVQALLEVVCLQHGNADAILRAAGLSTCCVPNSMNCGRWLESATVDFLVGDRPVGSLVHCKNGMHSKVCKVLNKCMSKKCLRELTGRGRTVDDLHIGTLGIILACEPAGRLQALLGVFTRLLDTGCITADDCLFVHCDRFNIGKYIDRCTSGTTRKLAHGLFKRVQWRGPPRVSKGEYLKDVDELQIIFLKKNTFLYNLLNKIF